MKAEKASEMKGAFIGILLLGSMIGGFYFLNQKHKKELAEEARKAKPVVVSGITRVFMHSVGHYSFLVRQKDHKIGNLSIRGYPDKIVIFEDLSDKESVRIEVMCGDFFNPRTCSEIPQSFSYLKIEYVNRLVIHLHSFRQIDGGGWNRGKSGNGMTTVIE